MNTPPKLQVFCPVDPSELDLTPSGVVCRKCQKGLVDVTNPTEFAKLANGVCGVMRRYVAPVVGSTIALSSCSVDNRSAGSDQPSEIMPPVDRSTTNKEHVILPGTYFYPGGETHDPDAYPTAEPTREPGIVISPYTHSKVDVSGMSEGQLVLDPAYKMADKKFFRVPAHGEHQPQIEKKNRTSRRMTTPDPFRVR